MPILWSTGAVAMPRWMAWLRIAILVALIVGGFLAVTTTGSLSADRVRDIVGSLGSTEGPLVFIVVAAVLVAVMFPLPPIAAAAGILFSTVTGTAVTAVGAVLGAAGCFLIARNLAADAADTVGGVRFQRTHRWIDERGFAAVFLTRVAPMPYSLVSYLAGLTRVPLHTFSAATAIGVLPRVYAYTAIGGNLTHLNSPQARIAFAILVGMFLIGLLLMVRDHRKTPHSN